MNRRDAVEVLGKATARLVTPSTAADDLLDLLVDCAAVLGADAIGLLVQAPAGGLELVSSTSHRATELELFELQHDRGPCVECVRSASPVSAVGRDLERQWHPVGEAIAAAGYDRVDALPVRWHDQVLGALNVFYTVAPREGDGSDGPDGPLGRAFANMVAATLTQSFEPGLAAVQERIRLILETRTVIDQAKGILGYQNDVDMAEAYALLVRGAAERGEPLSRYAAEVVGDVSAG